MKRRILEFIKRFLTWLTLILKKVDHLKMLEWLSGWCLLNHIVLKISEIKYLFSVSHHDMYFLLLLWQSCSWFTLGVRSPRLLTQSLSWLSHRLLISLVQKLHWSGYDQVGLTLISDYMLLLLLLTWFVDRDGGVYCAVVRYAHVTSSLSRIIDVV